MPAATPTLADGQVAITTPTALLTGVPGPVSVTFCNTGVVSETLVVTLARAGGTARRVARAVLAADEQLVLAGVPLNAADSLKAVTTTAGVVDYVVYAAPDAAPLTAYTLDANGAIKNGAAAIGSGSQTISGSLTISGDLTVSGGDVDAGASGAAGSVDVFPATASKGKLQITCTDQVGDTTVGLVAGAMAAARTLTIADPLASCNFLMGAQAAVARTATADGLTTGTVADAGRLQHVTVTSADANHIVVLPTPTPGTIVVLHVGATGFELRSSAPATVAINGGAGADAESAIAADSTCVMVCVSATAWKGFFLDADGDLAKVEAAA